MSNEKELQARVEKLEQQADDHNEVIKMHHAMLAMMGNDLTQLQAGGEDKQVDGGTGDVRGGSDRTVVAYTLPDDLGTLLVHLPAGGGDSVVEYRSGETRERLKLHTHHRTVRTKRP